MLPSSNLPICVSCLLICALFSGSTLGSDEDDHDEPSIEDLTNRCMRLIGEFSHDVPAQEPTLECPQYRESSCCRPGATQYFQEEDQWMNITNYNHCGLQKGREKLGQTCHDRFFDELCFFLCSPDIGPWIDIATHDEPVDDRIMKVPVCQSVCDEWWDACKDEYTCTDNWYIGFDSSGPGMHKCKEGSECKTYVETFGSSTHFCQNIWDNSFHVVADDKPCMQFDQDKTSGNALVARQRAEEIVNGATCLLQPCVALWVAIAAVLVVYKLNK